MVAAWQRPILWDIFEEHLDEASFLWGEWETALVAANYTLADVAAGPEERLAAHLDGLVLGGKVVAEKLLFPALGGDDLELVRPAAWALLQAEDADHFDVVLEALASAEPPKAAAIARATGLSRHPAIVSRLGTLWTHGSPPLRAVILDVIARRDLAWAAARVPDALRTEDPRLLAVALGLVRRLPDRDPAFVYAVNDALASPDLAVRGEAIATGVVLGSKAVWSACRRAVAEPGSGRLPFALLALSPDPADRELLRGCLKDPGTVRQALWAFGFAGDVDAADVLATFLPDEKLGQLAAEAFSTITGLSIDGRFRAAGVTHGPQEEEVGLDDPPPEVRPEDHLLAPDAAVVAAWWQKNRGRFQPGARFVAGGPRTVEALRTAMVTGPMWRREVVALEIAAGARGAVGDLTGWTREQLAGSAPAANGQLPR
jgi:uncharacterized protein (TIGR02270 family)